MSKSFDMELFIAGVLSGSYATRQRHVRQASLFNSPSKSGGGGIHPGNGRGSICTGFYAIASVTIVMQLAITTA